MNNKRGGFYWEDGVPYISVTTVLSDVIRKRALEYWYGQQVYLAMVKDPSLTERDALAAPYISSKKAASRGTTIHSVIEAYKQTGKTLETIPEEYRGYANAFYKWVKDVSPEFIWMEKTVTNKEHGYGGTLDLFAKIGNRELIIDFKTSKDGAVYNEAHLQVSAYRNCLQNDGGMIIGLAEDGTYNMQEARDGFPAFLSALELYKFLNHDKLVKLGWGKKGGI